MNRRLLFTATLVLLFMFGVGALILSATAPASARLSTSPLSDPPTPKFAPFTGLPQQIPPQLRAAYEATAHTPGALRGSNALATPDVLLYKWTPGNQARPGGVIVYSIYYANVGYANAGTVIITDTLPAQTT
jgi:uncharacterized repeat protein (TIGR01451 family)